MGKCLKRFYFYQKLNIQQLYHDSHLVDMEGRSSRHRLQKLFFQLVLSSPPVSSKAASTPISSPPPCSTNVIIYSVIAHVPSPVMGSRECETKITYGACPQGVHKAIPNCLSGTDVTLKSRNLIPSHEATSDLSLPLPKVTLVCCTHHLRVPTAE